MKMIDEDNLTIYQSPLIGEEVEHNNEVKAVVDVRQDFIHSIQINFGKYTLTSAGLVFGTANSLPLDQPHTKEYFISQGYREEHVIKYWVPGSAVIKNKKPLVVPMDIAQLRVYVKYLQCKSNKKITYEKLIQMRGVL